MQTKIAYKVMIIFFTVRFNNMLRYDEREGTR